MSLQDEVAKLGWWYHELELAEGVVTGGVFPHSVPATRAILKHVDLEGADCLDIGAMEGFFSILAVRQGAGRVMATDRYDFGGKIALAKRAFDVDFDYVPRTPLAGIHGQLKARWGKLADVVIFSGVLYHMFDPMGGLARVRGLVRNKGLAIVETIAAISDDSTLLLNDDFSIYGPSTYQIPTTAALGSMLKFVGLKPIDCRYFAIERGRGLRLCRIAVCCRASGIPVLSAEKPPWYAREPHAWYAEYAKGDFSEFLDADELESSGGKTVKYRLESDFKPGGDKTIASPLPMESFYNIPAMIAPRDWSRLGYRDVE